MVSHTIHDYYSLIKNIIYLSAYLFLVLQLC